MEDVGLKHVQKNVKEFLATLVSIPLEETLGQRSRTTSKEHPLKLKDKVMA